MIVLTHNCPTSSKYLGQVTTMMSHGKQTATPFAFCWIGHILGWGV